jgi:HEAT repeat protein
MSVASITKALALEDPEERRRATASLRDVPPEEGIGLVIRALGDDDWRVRKEAIAVAIAHAPAPVVLKALVSSLGPSDNVGLKNAAVEAIAAHGADAVDALAASLAELDADGRKLAAEALSKTGIVQALFVLKGLIRDADPNVRIAAVEAVAALGASDPKVAANILEGCLDSSDSFLRLAALDGLRALGVVMTWDRLSRLRSEPMLEPAVLAAAGHTADERAARALVDAIDRARGGTLFVILKSVVELARSGHDKALALQTMAKRLEPSAVERIFALASQPEDSEDRLTALLACGALGVQGAAELAILALDDELLEGAAEETLDWLGAPAVPALIERARTAESATRAICLEIAARLADAASAPRVREEIHAGLSDPAPEVVRAALGAEAIVGDASALADVAACLIREGSGPLKRAAESSLAVLAARFPDPARALAAAASPSEAHVVAVVVRVVGAPVRGSLAADVEFLSAALSSATPQVRRVSLQALAEVGGELAVEPIAFAVTDEEPEVRLSAVRALGRVRGADGAPLGTSHLIGLVERAVEPDLVSQALLSLGETGDPRALPILRPFMRSGDPTAAVAAIEALGAFPEARRVEALIEGLSHVAAEVVKAALLSLGESSDPRVLLHLGACLDHEAWDVRRLVADLLARYGGPAAGPLRARLAVEDDPLVREAIGRALERVAGVRKSTPPTRGSYWPR